MTVQNDCRSRLLLLFLSPFLLLLLLLLCCQCVPHFNLTTLVSFPPQKMPPRNINMARLANAVERIMSITGKDKHYRAGKLKLKLKSGFEDIVDAGKVDEDVAEVEAPTSEAVDREEQGVAAVMASLTESQALMMKALAQGQALELKYGDILTTAVADRKQMVVESVRRRLSLTFLRGGFAQWKWVVQRANLHPITKQFFGALRVILPRSRNRTLGDAFRSWKTTMGMSPLPPLEYEHGRVDARPQQGPPDPTDWLRAAAVAGQAQHGDRDPNEATFATRSPPLQKLVEGLRALAGYPPGKTFDDSSAADRSRLFQPYTDPVKDGAEVPPVLHPEKTSVNDEGHPFVKATHRSSTSAAQHKTQANVRQTDEKMEEVR
jgi:hypothetical protein